MTMRDLHHNIEVLQTYAPQTETLSTAEQAFTGVDSRGFEAIEHVVNMGNSADTLSGSLYWLLRIQDSTDNVTFADVTDANDVLQGGSSVVTFVASGTGVFATIDAPSEDTRVFRVGYRGVKRYSRVMLEAVGNMASGTIISAVGIQARASERPTSDAGI